MRERHIMHGYFSALIRVPTWSALNRLGQSRVLRSSYFWLAAVPILARILEHVGQQHDIRLFGATLHISLGLPFSWKILFYASFVFSIASFVYSIACPGLVRSYQRFSDFTAEGKASRQIIDAFSDTLHRSGSVVFFDEFVEKFTVFSPEHAETSTTIVSPIYTRGADLHARRTLVRARVPDDRLADAFWYVRDLADIASPKLRWLCLICYSAGFALLSVILIQNLLYVVRNT